jgi:hypothetical protein
VKGRAVVALLALGLAVGLVVLRGTPEAVSSRPLPLGTPIPAPPPAATVAPVQPPTPGRNLFEYGIDVPPPLPPPPPPADDVETVDGPPSPRLPVRLVGVVVQGGELRAALAHAGDVLVMSAGESLSGYTVLAVDADEGVRLRTPEGEEIVLSAPEAE